MVANAVEHDYCVELCVRSMAVFCDEVVIGYSESTDGTIDLLKSIESELKNVRIVNENADFTVRNGGTEWMMSWMDRVRSHIKHPYQVQLDCDEIIADWSIPEIIQAAKDKKSLWCNRINFWGRLDRVTPPGAFCGNKVPRCAPSHYSLPSDFPVSHERAPVLNVLENSTVDVLHYCTLRKPDAFWKKSKSFQTVLVDSYDTRIDEAMKLPTHWSDYFTYPDPFLTFDRKHPEMCHAWLRERGYNP